MKGLIRAMRRAPTVQAVVKRAIPVKNLALSVAGTSGVGWGTAVLEGLPSGNILLLGAVAYMQFRSADADVVATYDGDYSIGTTATSDATLSATDANITPSAALGAASAGLSPVVRSASSATPAVLDNTDGSLELNLNLIVDDDNISGTADFTASGVVHISYIVLGDD